MRVLVTGLQGWIGRFVQASAPPEAELLGVGRSPELPGFSSGRPLPSGLELKPARYQALDLRDPIAVRRLLERERPGLVLHLAGGTHTAPPELLDALNRQATLHLLDGMAPGTRMVLGSTGSIYGDTLGGPQAVQGEEHPCHPLTNYAKSKLVAEQAARLRAEERGISLVSARIFNVVGPGQPPTYLPGVLAKQLAEILAGTAPPVLRMGPLNTVRDYIDVRDCAADLWLLAQSGLEGVVNLGSGRPTVVQEVFDLLLERALELGAPPVEIDRLPPFPSNVQRQVAGLERMAGLGFRPRSELRQSLCDLLADCYELAGDEPPDGARDEQT